MSYTNINGLVTIGFPVNFKTLLFEKLPYYYKSEDTYKDIYGKGLLERYLSIFGDYIDTDMVPDIEAYIALLDVTICDEKFLTHISNSLGNPPDIFKEAIGYRSLLQYIVNVYKIKGTEEAYRLYFSILGYDIILTEVTPPGFGAIVSLENRYDSNDLLVYDDVVGFEYDFGQCETCSEYDLELTPKPSNTTIVDDALLLRINETIKFNEPINAILRNLIIN